MAKHYRPDVTLLLPNPLSHGFPPISVSVLLMVNSFRRARRRKEMLPSMLLALRLSSNSKLASLFSGPSYTSHLYADHTCKYAYICCRKLVYILTKDKKLVYVRNKQSQSTHLTIEKGNCTYFYVFVFS